MLSTEIMQRLAAMVEEYRQKELDFLEMLGRIEHPLTRQSKPRIRVKAISNRWPTSAPSNTRIAREP